MCDNVPANARPTTVPGKPNPYFHTQHDDLSTGGAHFSGNPSYKVDHPNALCVTSRPGSILSEKCQAAFDAQQSGLTKCDWNGSHLVSVYSDNLPSNNIPKQCSKTDDPNEICLPEGTIPLLCMGQEEKSGQGSIAPSWIAVPRSEAIHDLVDTGCYSADPQRAKDPHAYVKTTNWQNPHSNPTKRLGY